MSIYLDLKNYICIIDQINITNILYAAEYM